MKINHLAQTAKKALQAQAPDPFQESLWILAETLRIPIEKILSSEEEIGLKQKKLFWDKIKRRQRGEPLAYILKESFFCGMAFYVEPGVFIPRRETEALVEWAARRFQDRPAAGLDFGAGAGAICLSLLKALPQSRFSACDISPKALEVLKKNSQLLKLQGRISVLQKDIGQLDKEDLKGLLKTSPDLITANPPYIDPEDGSCNEEVRLFEPPLALFSDQKGMGHIFAWYKKALSLLGPGGVYIFEMGWNQSGRLRAFLNRQTGGDLASYEILMDQAGQKRFAVCFKK